MTIAVVYRDVEKLIPYARNARTHSDAQVAEIAGSIREFGWTFPILIDEHNNVIAGHGRLLAARKLEMASVPCIEHAGLTETQRKAYILADNKLALNAGWDNDLLRVELTDLQHLGFDIGLAGFTADEILGITPEPTNEGSGDEDDVPEVPVDPITQPGDIWLLGVFYQCEACGKQYSQEEGEMMTHCPCDSQNG